MKEQCYEIFLLETLTRGGGTQSSSLSLEVLGEAEDALDSLLEKFDNNSFAFMTKVNKAYINLNWWPWAIIVFSEEYRLAGHLASIRKSTDDFNFSGHGLPSNYSIEENGVPPVSIISIKNKEVLNNIAEKSPLLKSAWELLKDREDNKRWLVFPEPLDKQLLSGLLKGDDELFLKLIKKSLTTY